ncbi:hypothetical protein BDQ17DRAFT_1332798 [Cyathus striatus]|nr:hypothetical protein BDQ17DRAFT_1332798 [Cyathus striatus]
MAAVLLCWITHYAVYFICHALLRVTSPTPSNPSLDLQSEITLAVCFDFPNFLSQLTLLKDAAVALLLWEYVVTIEDERKCIWSILMLRVYALYKKDRKVGFGLLALLFSDAMITIPCGINSTFNMPIDPTCRARLQLWVIVYFVSCIYFHNSKRSPVINTAETQQILRRKLHLQARRQRFYLDMYSRLWWPTTFISIAVRPPIVFPIYILTLKPTDM